MNALVIDSSTALGFVLKDEQELRALRAREFIKQGVPTFVPMHWSVEVANGLLMAERRKRTTQSETSEALNLVSALTVETDDETADRATGDVVALARQYTLTVYDAVYLELAMRKGATLATGDAALAKAAKAAGVKVLA